MTPLEQALIAAARAFVASFEDTHEVQARVEAQVPQTQLQTQAAQAQTEAQPQQPAAAMTEKELHQELKNLETQTQGRLFSQISPLLIKYLGAIPGPAGSQMPAGGINQLPAESYAPFLQEAQALAMQLMQQGGTVQ